MANKRFKRQEYARYKKPGIDSTWINVNIIFIYLKL